MSTEASESAEVRYARVGVRMHLVPGGDPVYVGQPEVALCGTVFIRTAPTPVDPPLCYDCHRREVDRLRHVAEEALREADDIALALRFPSGQDGES